MINVHFLTENNISFNLSNREFQRWPTTKIDYIRDTINTLYDLAFVKIMK